MTTSKEAIHPSTHPADASLRLQLSAGLGRGTLDGAWWPHSRDLALKFADLVDHFPVEVGRVDRGGFSPPNWNPATRRIPTARGYVKVGSFPTDDTHVMVLSLSSRQHLRPLVVPPTTEPEQAAAMMAAASLAGNNHTAIEILRGHRSAAAEAAELSWTDQDAQPQSDRV